MSPGIGLSSAIPGAAAKLSLSETAGFLMTLLYAYCLLPVLSVALLLFFTVVLRNRTMWGLAAYSGSIALWSANLLLTFIPAVAPLALRTAAVGAFVAAGFLHAAFDFTDQKDYRLVWLAYLIATVITALGAVSPGMLYDPVSLSAGPLFWPSMLLAVMTATVPCYQLFRAYRRVARDPDRTKRRDQLRTLMFVGAICYLGAWTNATMLAHGLALPYGMLAVLASLLLLANLVQTTQPAATQRLLERSLLYSSLTALLFAAFLFTILVFMTDNAEPLLAEYRVGALFLLCLAALAFEPVRQHTQELVGRKFFHAHAHTSELAHTLIDHERRAHQAERLAELGTFTSAIAHEVRNPLGVLTAYVSILERQGADPETTNAMREQIDRASHFVSDLLEYGRPHPLDLRVITLEDTLLLAKSSATSALNSKNTSHNSAPTDVTWEFNENTTTTLEADQAQLLQVAIILLENALLALQNTPDPKISITTAATTTHVTIHITDNGPGIDPALQETLFEPFVTSRKRDATQHGTGLGLAIARGIIERHGGTITTQPADPKPGTTFTILLPRFQNVLAAAHAALATSP